MADVCTNSVSPNSCSHFNVSGDDAGELWTEHVHDSELLEPLSNEEKSTLRRLLLRKLRQRDGGITLSQFIGRVVRGEEATNVKQYDVIAAGSAITKTNIGTSYVDVLPGANGVRSLIDFTGCTQWRVILSANVVGTGQLGVRLLRDSDSAVMVENANIGAAGERELDTGWVNLPAEASGLMLVRLQAKSTVGADDPIFRRCVVVVK